MVTGCEKENELPSYYAKGTIIAVTGGCYGEIVVIEVETPQNIGYEGSFTTIDEEVNITYENAIGVPYFSKIGISGSVPETVGTWLYFKYRELTGEEKEQGLFSSQTPMFCPAIFGSPYTKPMIITKILKYRRD